MSDTKTANSVAEDNEYRGVKKYKRGQRIKWQSVDTCSIDLSCRNFYKRAIRSWSTKILRIVINGGEPEKWASKPGRDRPTGGKRTRVLDQRRECWITFESRYWAKFSHFFLFLFFRYFVFFFRFFCLREIFLNRCRANCAAIEWKLMSLINQNLIFGAPLNFRANHTRWIRRRVLLDKHDKRKFNHCESYEDTFRADN